MSKEKNLYFAYRSFWPELETTKEFNRRGIKTVCFISGNTMNSLGEPYCKYPLVWVWYDTYNFDVLDQQINDIVSVAPDAELICKIDLNTPLWWTRWTKWQNETSSSYDSYYNLGQLALWEKWRKDTSNYLEAFLKHCKKKYKNKIKAYALGCGAAGEWVDRSNGEESPFRYEAYRKWMKANNLDEPSDIPGRSVRSQCTHEFLRDPEKDSIGINYWKFTAWQVADTIEYLAKKARKIVKNDAELGVFYGYAVELSGARLVNEGHLEYEKICQCKEIDFLIAPASYSDRQMGGGSGFLCITETMKRYGKQFLQECDQRTHTTNFNLSKYVRMDFPHWENVESTIAGIKREMALCLINRTSLWFFDMWGGFYNDPKVLETMKQLKNIWDTHKETTTQDIAEILLVIDPESAYYMRGGTDGKESEFNQKIKNKLNRMGTPFRICSFNDIPHINGLEKIKLVILATPFVMNDKKLKIVSTNLMNKNRTILFFHAPGIIKNGRWDEANVKKICSFDFKTPGLNVKKMKNWTSAYIYDPGALEISDIRSLTSDAGVHFYCKQNIPVFANNRLVSIHCGDANKNLEISFPKKFRKITDLFTGKEYLSTDNIKKSFRKPETFLFLTE